MSGVCRYFLSCCLLISAARLDGLQTIKEKEIITMSEENKNPVDFNDPASIEAELAAAESSTAAKATGTKAPKERKPRTIKVSFTAEQDIKAGETIEFEYTLPKASSRGQVVGIPLEEMTDDQLKIEYRNANSVYYKTSKAGRDASKAKERLERCKAEMDKRGIAPTGRGATKLDAASIANAIKSGKVSVDDIQKLLDAASAANEAAEG